MYSRLLLYGKITTQIIPKNSGLKYFSKKYIKREFEIIKNVTDNEPEHKAQLNVLKPKLCRYKGIYPYKSNTVKLNEEGQEINASWVNLPKPQSYIATQGPPKACIDDFWEMCFKYQVNLIIMLCQVIENKIEKCSEYWKVNSQKYQLKNIEEKKDNQFIERKIVIVDFRARTERTFNQLQFLNWPDHKVPNVQELYQTFVRMIKFTEENKKETTSPVVIHCSAGVGRTGTFIASSILYREISISSNKESIEFNIFNLVRKLKEFRLYMVENIAQYKLIYAFVEAYLKEINSEKK